MTEKRFRLPPLDFIQGFEAAARNLSFTRAADELFLTQSAVSRQIKALEDHLGIALFERRPRALALTEEGEAFYRVASDTLQRLQDATERIKTSSRGRPVAVTTTIGFASLWLVPRLPRFTGRHPNIDVRIAARSEVLNLERSLIDLAIRYCAPESAPGGASRLFGEEVFPVCSPSLLGDAARPLKTPSDLQHHVLLHEDSPGIERPFMDWGTWLTSFGVGDIAPAALHFSHSDQIIQAAISGQGIALGMTPLINEHLRSGVLVAPFDKTICSSRAYYLIKSAVAARRPQVDEFVAWLMDEAKRESC
jgi:LysR family transcriptional regulator, glycine cleavage system transcriptional activator